MCQAHKHLPAYEFSLNKSIYVWGVNHEPKAYFLRKKNKKCANSLHHITSSNSELLKKKKKSELTQYKISQSLLLDSHLQTL